MTSVSGVKEIAAGTNHSIMLAENGYVYSVGNDSNSQLGNGNSTNISTPTYVRNTSGNLVSDAKHVKSRRRLNIHIKKKRIQKEKHKECM